MKGMHHPYSVAYPATNIAVLLCIILYLEYIEIS
jgi:hypothetical protein